ncbi:MAG: winged helix-turn-helix domain-containing protein [Methanomassiliicoccales archaeon]|jgi:DNA-binding HxlR family transcriptional regulator|nr:winged helix-turn-helix domain-containing protein [Methanomassiliicoccales archaeon]
MESEQILKELNSLRKEIETLSETLLHTRYDDFKSTFIEQIQQIFSEESQRLLKTEMCRFDISSNCSRKSECITKIEKVVNEIIELFQSDNVDAAITLIEEIETMILGTSSPCLDPNCSKFALDFLHQIKCYIAIFNVFKARVGAGTNGNKTMCAPSSFSPEQVETILSPLSNAWRIRILELLSTNQRTFSEISRHLGLRTGHLQFHMKLLRNSRYIDIDKRTHVYRITTKGIAALRGIKQMLELLSISENHQDFKRMLRDQGLQITNNIKH